MIVIITVILPFPRVSTYHFRVGVYCRCCRWFVLFCFLVGKYFKLLQSHSWDCLLNAQRHCLLNRCQIPIKMNHQHQKIFSALHVQTSMIAKMMAIIIIICSKSCVLSGPLLPGEAHVGLLVSASNTLPRGIEGFLSWGSRDFLLLSGGLVTYSCLRHADRTGKGHPSCRQSKPWGWHSLFASQSSWLPLAMLSVSGHTLIMFPSLLPR